MSARNGGDLSENKDDESIVNQRIRVIDSSSHLTDATDRHQSNQTMQEYHYQAGDYSSGGGGGGTRFNDGEPSINNNHQGITINTDEIIPGACNRFNGGQESNHSKQIGRRKRSKRRNSDCSCTSGDLNSLSRHHHYCNNNSHHLSSSSDNLIDKCAPRDRYKLVCFGFTILGVTTLLPWNFFITATDYWMHKFRDTTTTTTAAAVAAVAPDEFNGDQRTPMQTFFESYLAIAANLPMLVSMIVNSLYGQRYSQKKRLYVSLSVMLSIFALTTVFVKIDTDDMQTFFFVITMIMVTVVSFFSAIFQAAIFGIVASFPSNCMHAMVNGQAVAGLLAVTIQILSMLNNSGPLMSGLWYFLASTVFLAFAIICYWLMDNDYTRYYLVKIPDEHELSTSLSVSIIEDKSDIIEALRDCWQMASVVILSFWASLAVFPGVCVLVVPQHTNISLFSGRFYTTITTFLLFNCGDLAGRMCSAYLPFPTRRKNLLLGLALARAVFPLAILFCNVHPRHNTPVLLESDLFFPILNSLSALTNGYLFSSAMLMASEHSQKQRLEMTGFVMASSLGIGLTLGSISSTILLLII